MLKKTGNLGLEYLLTLAQSRGTAVLMPYFWPFSFALPISVFSVQLCFDTVAACTQYVRITHKKGGPGHLRCKKKEESIGNTCVEMFSSAHRHSVSNIHNDFLAPCRI